MAEYVELMDTTLRDGEQCQGVSFRPVEKLAIAKYLLKEAKIDRAELGSALVSEGEKKAITKIAKWAKKNNLVGRIEVLGFVDYNKSADWIKSCGVKTINLLVKGSLNHCKKQLRKTAGQHFADVKKTVNYAKKNGLKVNVYPEAWSTGMLEDENYVFDLVGLLSELKVERVMLPDTLGVLSPDEAYSLVSKMVERFPSVHFDFHAHNDYGMGTANSLAAANAGAKGVHVTVNALGERAGNVSLDEVVAALKDKGNFKIGVAEKKMFQLSRMVERFSGKRVPENKPISGEDVFTQTAGIHADGDKKGNLYESLLKPGRFGREREYALGKLSGKASLEMNLKKQGIELTKEQKAKVLERVIALGDKKEKITSEDLPYIVSDVIDTPEKRDLRISNCIVFSGKNITPTASFTLEFKGKEHKASSSGDGGYDALMNALKNSSKEVGFNVAELVDYEVRIPPGGKTDALVETTIAWQLNGKRFKTTGVDSDQVMAAIKATEKMLNIVNRKNGK